MTSPGEESSTEKASSPRFLCICNDDGKNCSIKDSQNKPVIEFAEWTKLAPNATQATEDTSAACAKGNKRWTWQKNEECYLYYVLLFDDREHRVRNYEILALPDKTTDEFPETIENVLVLSLFKKANPDHEFLEIREANGCEFDVVIDRQSEVKQTHRTARRCPIYFGFLSPSHSKLEKSERVALKKECISSNDSEKVKKIREEITMAMKAGGQYNMKYLAHTNIEAATKDVWIAMELCCMETLDDLINMKKGNSYVIKCKEMKILFRHILLGLSHLHMRRIAHGEMIMENILLSLDHECLKIGDYDHVKQIEQQDSATTFELDQEFKNDIAMTASMLFMCLSRNAKHNSKEKSTGLSKECQDWLSELTSSTASTGDTVKITETIFPNVGSEYIKKAITADYDVSAANWPLHLRELAKKLQNSNEHSSDPIDPYLSAYLIIHMALDEPKPQEVLRHPFFWDEFKILCFISRADAFFNNDKKYNLENHASQIRSELQKDCECLWPDFQWLKALEDSLNEQKSKGKSDNAQKNILSKSAEVQKHHGPSDITGLLRVIRNIHNHYHEPDIKDRWFGSSSEVWKHFNVSMYPGMICLLHRAVWKKRDSSELPDDLRRFFNKSDYALNLPDFGKVSIN